MVGTVKEVRDFGAILEVLRGRTGMLHMSEISPKVSGVDAPKLLAVGDRLTVECLEVDNLSGAVKLSRKRLMKDKFEPLLYRIKKPQSGFSRNGRAKENAAGKDQKGASQGKLSRGQRGFSAKSLTKI